MKTYLRCSIHVSTMTYPFKAPSDIIEACNELKEKCRKFEEKKVTGIYVVPIDTKEYGEILRFKEKYKEFFHGNLFYVHKFTKKEIDNSNFFLLRCRTLIEDNYDALKTFEMQCEHCNIYGKQIKNISIKKNSLGNRLIAFSYGYKFIVSANVKKRFEEEKISNVKFIPVYNKSYSEIEAYQLESEKTIPELAAVNNWTKLKHCPYCNSVQWNGIANINHPLYIPKEYMKDLKDINSTFEVFTEVSCRYIIISRKVYDILRDMNVKKLEFEPVIFV